MNYIGVWRAAPGFANKLGYLIFGICTYMSMYIYANKHKSIWISISYLTKHLGVDIKKNGKASKYILYRWVCSFVQLCILVHIFIYLFLGISKLSIWASMKVLGLVGAEECPMYYVLMSVQQILFRCVFSAYCAYVFCVIQHCTWFPTPDQNSL